MRRNRKRAGGFTLVELAISMAIMATVMMYMTVALQREARGLSQLHSVSNQERVVQDLLSKIESHLDFAQGTVPEAALTSSLPANESFVVAIDTTDGFPDIGVITVAPGNVNEERIRYADLDPDGPAVLLLDRGWQGTTAAAHPNGTAVRWAPAARVLDEPINPPAGTFDGTSRELLADLAYRGNGTGFSYRVPVDPAGGTNYLTPTGVRWGATVGGRPTEDGRACIYFEAVAQVTEAARNFDFNRDGDLLDTFDVGRLRQRAWDAVDGANASSDLALCPPIIIQELNAWGSDLDNDGFEDPIFLWTPASGRLRVRLFAFVGQIGGRQVIKQYETVLHLRNGADQ